MGGELCWRNGLGLLFLFQVVVQLANGKCANDCFANGFCRANGTVNDRCECDSYGSIGSKQRFSAVDCSQRACPTGKAWVDYASANNVAHAAGAECSNKGHCERKSGVCACQSGYTGPACDRTHCPGDPNRNGTVCSGRGKCLSIGEMALAEHKDGVRLTAAPTTYTLWDHDMIFGCVCEEGFGGHDCSTMVRACPTGDDPLTTGQVNEVQIVECTCLAVCSGSFRLRFRGELSPPIPHYATAERLRHELEKMGTIGGGVTVALFGAGAAGSAFVCDADGVSTAITFTHEPGNLPALEVLYSDTLLSNSGTDPVMSVKSTPGAGAQGGTAVTGTRENVECSGRGSCALASAGQFGGGYCACNPGFVSSNGAGAAGGRGDCGFQSSSISACAGAASPCNGVGSCSGSPLYACTCNLQEKQTITCIAASGTFTLSFGGQTTAALQWNANAATVQGAVAGLTSVVSATVTFSTGAAACAAAPGVGMIVTFTGPAGSANAGDMAAMTENVASLQGVQEVQTLTCVATSGSFTLSFGGQISIRLQWDDNAATVQGAVAGLSAVISATVTFSTGTSACAVGAGVDMIVTFTANVGDMDPITFDVASLFDYPNALPQFTVVETTKGVAGAIKVVETTKGSTGYEGHTCEFKTCPSGTAWFDEPTSTDTAHAMAVCSNRGACNRATGACTCDLVSRQLDPLARQPHLLTLPTPARIAPTNRPPTHRASSASIAS